MGRVDPDLREKTSFDNYVRGFRRAVEACPIHRQAPPATPRRVHWRLAVLLAFFPGKAGKTMRWKPPA